MVDNNRRRPSLPSLGGAQEGSENAHATGGGSLLGTGRGAHYTPPPSPRYLSAEPPRNSRIGPVHKSTWAEQPLSYRSKSLTKPSPESTPGSRRPIVHKNMEGVGHHVPECISRSKAHVESGEERVHGPI